MRHRDLAASSDGRGPGPVVRVLAVSAASLSVVFVLLELTARVYLFGLAGLHPCRVDSVRPLTRSGLVRASPDPEIGFELRPDLDAWFALAPFRTSSRGLRDREYTLEKPPDVFRIAVVGSSFTLPTGVAIEDAFHSVLEERLAGASAGTRYEVVNFAVGAHHPAQTMAILEHRVPAYDPDLVVFGLTSMSARAALKPRVFVVPQPEAPVHPFFHSFLWKLIRLRTSRPGPGVDLTSGRPPPAPGPSVIDRLSSLAARESFPIVVLRLEFSEMQESRADRRLRERVVADGLHYVDTRAPFAGMSPEQLWIYPLDPHPNATAHAIFADVLEQYLRRHDLLGAPAGPVSSPDTRTEPSAASR